MKVSKNDKGQDVYELSKITDIALLPDHMAEHALEVLPLFVYSLRLQISGAIANGTYEEWMAICPDSVEIVDDGEMRASFSSGDRSIFDVRMVKDSHED